MHTLHSHQQQQTTSYYCYYHMVPQKTSLVYSLIDDITVILDHFWYIINHKVQLKSLLLKISKSPTSATFLILLLFSKFSPANGFTVISLRFE